MTRYHRHALLSYWPILIPAFIVALSSCGGEPTGTPTLPQVSAETPAPASVPSSIAGPTLSPEATAGIPLSISYPADGLLVTEPTVQVTGGSRQDAVVGVLGKPVAVNDLGIFSTTVYLVEGANLIEVVAVDIEQNVNFQTVVVFYEP